MQLSQARGCHKVFWKPIQPLTDLQISKMRSLVSLVVNLIVSNETRVFWFCCYLWCRNAVLHAMCHCVCRWKLLA